MKILILNVPIFSGNIISPTWIKAARDFQSKSKAERDSYCVVVVPGTWHGKFKKEWPTEEEKKHIGKNGILNL